MRHHLTPGNFIMDGWTDKPIGNVLRDGAGWAWLFNDDFVTSRLADAVNCGLGFADRVAAFKAAHAAI